MLDRVERASDALEKGNTYAMGGGDIISRCGGGTWRAALRPFARRFRGRERGILQGRASRRSYWQRGSPSTVAGATAATPTKIAQVRAVAAWLATALHPVPPVAAYATLTPEEGV